MRSHGQWLVLAAPTLCSLVIVGCGDRAAPSVNTNNNANANHNANTNHNANANNNTNNAECSYWTHDYDCDGNVLEGCSTEGVLTEIDCAALGGICVEDDPVCRMPPGQCGDSFDTICVTSTVLGRNYYGTCTLIECPAGQVCVEGSTGNPPLNGRCVLSAMIPCDPATYPGQCHGGDTVRYCNQGYVTAEACAPDETCVDGRCRHPGAVPCDPYNFERYCENGATIDCHRDGYTNRTLCSAGLVCQVGTSGYPQCVIDPPTPCDESTFETQCVQDWAALTCYDGFETYTHCDECICDTNGCECLLIG